MKDWTHTAGLSLIMLRDQKEIKSLSVGMRTGPDAWIKREGAPWVEAVYVEMGYNSCSEKS